MNEPVKFPVFVVMRNGHIMPPGIHLHRANAETTAAREEGEVVPLVASPPAAQGQKAVAQIFEADKTAAVIVDMFIGRTSGETPDELEAIRIQDIENVLRVLRHETGISCYGYLNPKDKMFWRNQNMCGESRVMMREQKWIPLWTVPVASPAPASGEGMNAAGEITGYVPSSLQKSIAERLMPEGWVIVPREPTDAMKAACDNTPGPMTAYKAWQVMLAAAPVQGETE